MIEEQEQLVQINTDKLIFLIEEDEFCIFLFKYVAGIVLTLLFPGLGHVMLYQYKKASLLFILNVTLRLILVFVYATVGFASYYIPILGIIMTAIAFPLIIVALSFSSDVCHDFCFLFWRLRNGYPICEEEFFVEPLAIRYFCGSFKEKFVTWRPEGCPKNWLEYCQHHDMDLN